MWRQDKMDGESGDSEGTRVQVDNNDLGVIRATQLDCKIVMTCFFAPNPTLHLTSWSSSTTGNRPV